MSSWCSFQDLYFLSWTIYAVKNNNNHSLKEPLLAQVQGLSFNSDYSNYSSKNWHNYLKLCPCVHPKMCVRAFSHHSSFHVSGSLSMASTKGISTAQVWTRYVQSSQRRKCACWMSSLMWVTPSFSPSLYCILSLFWKLPVSEADRPVTLFEDFLFGLCHHKPPQ